jgi:hypothetical protein
MDTNVHEIWLPILGYEGFYKVSSLGRIRSLSPRNSNTIYDDNSLFIRKQTIEKNGYHRVQLVKKGDAKIYLVHRLVAMAFIQNPENKRCVNHIDCDRSNNMASNLEWCTYQENENHKSKLGRQASGQRHGMSKLTDRDIRYIRENYIKGENCKILAKMFCVEKSRITKIVSGTNWKHII